MNLKWTDPALSLMLLLLAVFLLSATALVMV